MENRMRGLTAIDRWARHELAEAWPPFLFFLSGFLMLLLIVKLTLATLDVRLTALSKAIVGALLAAKAVLIIDATPLARHLEQYRRIFVVAIKTLIYGSVTLMLGDWYREGGDEPMLCFEVRLRQAPDNALPLLCKAPRRRQ